MIEYIPSFIRDVSVDVDVHTESLYMMFKRLEVALKSSSIPGVGLAGIQIGIHKRVAIIRTEKTTLNLWNPEIVELGDEKVISPEGCLSFPGETRSISRVKEVTLKNGDGRQYVLYGFEAIVVQHEIDRFVDHG